MPNRKNKPLSILYIGNSFSYYHALPALVARFARASGVGNLAVDGAFRGGATLKMLWDGGEALKKLRSRHWDYVVLQERGRLAGIVKNGVVHVGKPQKFIAYAARFQRVAKASGAKIILYCPPAFIGTGLLEDAKKLDATYTVVARRLGVEVVLPRKAFLFAMQKRPRMNLFEQDKHHPNPLGIYLIACLFYRKLFHKKISKLPLLSFVSESARLPKKPKTITVGGADARFLWSVANRVQ